MWTSFSLGMHAKPVAVLDPEGLYDPLWAWLDVLIGRGFVRQSALDVLHRTRPVDDAFAVLGRCVLGLRHWAADVLGLRHWAADAAGPATLGR